LAETVNWLARPRLIVSRALADRIADGTPNLRNISSVNEGVAQRLDPALIRRLLRARDCMDAASHEDWSIGRLAGISGVSEAHFARSFCLAFGLPPHRYLLTRRIERAKALLRDSDAPVTAIAFETGWNSLGTFGRTFRDVTGETPSSFRDRQRGTRATAPEVPACFLSAAQRPDLRIAVSEKRRLEVAGREEGD